MNASPQPKDGDGGKTVAIAAIFIVAILSVLYFLNKKPSGGAGSDGDGDGGGGGGGAQSQTETRERPPDEGVDLNDPVIFNRIWAMIIDIIGSVLLGIIAEKLRAAGEEKAKKKAAADANTSDGNARARADADKAKADAEEKARANAEEKARKKAATDPSPSDGNGRARAEADKAKANAEEKARLNAEEKAKKAAATDPTPGDGNGKLRVNVEINRASVDASNVEEKFANDAANDKAVRGDKNSKAPNSGGSRKMQIETAKAEGKLRKSVDAKMYASDATNNVRTGMDVATTKIEGDARKRANLKAVNDDVADGVSRINDAKLNNRATVNAMAEDAKASKERAARRVASATADAGGPAKNIRVMQVTHDARSPTSGAKVSDLVEPTEKNPKTGQPGDESVKLRSGPAHDASPHGAFGAQPSKRLQKTTRFREWFGEKMAQHVQQTNRTRFGQSTSHLVDSTAGPTQLSKKQKAIRTTVRVLGALDFASDAIMVFQVLADSFFYGAFPDESTLLTRTSVDGILTKALQKQIDVATLYNKNIVDPGNVGYEGQEYARTQWPLIMGPLDIPSLHTVQGIVRPKMYPEYEQQQLVQAEIDSIREKLLRKTGPFKDAWIGSLGLANYNATMADPADSLVNYVDGNFDAATSDELYRQAFSNVCAYYDGIVYEDMRPADDPAWANRPRFQCGWKNARACENSAKQWLATDGDHGGSYAEWYSYDQLNDGLRGITATPALPITCCAGTGTTYVDKCGIADGHPLRRDMAGACIAATSGVAAVCEKSNGTYDVATHACIFSPKYCQSIGTCFDETAKMCYLPGEAMFAMSMTFGTGGPREWIKINGCQFASSPLNTFENIMMIANPLTSLFTKNGRTFWNDMYANNKNWSKGLEKTLGNPMMIAMISSIAVLSIVTSTTIAATAAASSVAVIASAGATMATIAAASAGPTLGLSVLVMAIAIGITIGAEEAKANKVENLKGPDPKYGPYASEYTVGGWKDGVGTSAPVTLGFNRGWVSKPMRAHSLQNWPPTAITHTGANGATINTPAPPATFSHVKDMPGVNQIQFYQDDITAIGVDDGTTRAAVDIYVGVKEPPVAKKLCYMESPSKIRVGADSAANKAWCITPFPPIGYADTTNIGPLALDPVTLNADGTVANTDNGSSGKYMTSVAWTNGVNPGVPQYPFGEADNPQYASNGNQPAAWHYQVVYDKDKMIGLTQATTADGVAIAKGFPTHLWNTDFLRFHFLDTTIQAMRQYYCLQHLAHFPDGGNGMPDKCWGYLDIEIPGYRYMAMTLPGEMMSSAEPQPVCSAGDIFNHRTNMCEGPNDYAGQAPSDPDLSSGFTDYGS